MPGKHAAPAKTNKIVKIVKKTNTEIKMFQTIVRYNAGNVKRSVQLHKRLKALQK